MTREDSISVDRVMDRAGMQPLARGSLLEWKEVSVILKGKDSILIDKVSGAALPGRILALMGPSGAGKHTV
jgi:ABC-type Fe3+/spermidine/putrescine transport system ATPase subunit